jgi:succinate-semialdehyde dehydrogenase/glutarate-semialdehyde dehydrogenase
VTKGARILAGGKRLEGAGLFYQPTVLVDVNESMDVMNLETFGPVLPIRRVKDGEEALQLSNRSEYGLNASVWSKDRARADQIARELESGSVCVNDCIISYEAIEAPFGGVKHSGVGRRKGPDGIRKYCNQKTVVEDIFGLKREPIWYPYSPQATKAVRNAIQLLFGRGLSAKVSAVRKMVGL